jgi:hypothetical protein
LLGNAREALRDALSKKATLAFSGAKSAAGGGSTERQKFAL